LSSYKRKRGKRRKEFEEGREWKRRYVCNIFNVNYAKIWCERERMDAHM
jgi:hypothetical protein